MKRLAILALLILAGCASIRERVNRDSYLATGRAPSAWTPKKSLCPDFKRNGWQDHPPAKDGCFAPPARVGAAK